MTTSVRLGAWALAAALLAPTLPSRDAQEPAAATSRISRHLVGRFAGPEQGPLGRHRGYCDFRPALDGSWIRLSYHSLAGDQPFYAAEQWLRESADGTVHAWHFNGFGEVSVWEGKGDERGLTLRSFDDAGNLMDVQVFEWDQEGHEFTLLHRESPAEDLAPLVVGSYRRVEQLPELAVDEAARTRAAELPYGFYLGTFEGREHSEHGASTGRIATRVALDGAWYRSEYRSLAGGNVAYAGTGFTRCDAEGNYQLWWFGYGGETVELAGKVGAGGARALRRDTSGAVLERHTDRFTERGYTFRIETRASASAPWRTYLEADYLRQP